MQVKAEMKRAADPAPDAPAVKARREDRVRHLLRLTKHQKKQLLLEASQRNILKKNEKITKDALAERIATHDLTVRKVGTKEATSQGMQPSCLLLPSLLCSFLSLFTPFVSFLSQVPENSSPATVRYRLVTYHPPLDKL